MLEGLYNVYSLMKRDIYDIMTFLLTSYVIYVVGTNCLCSHFYILSI